MKYERVVEIKTDSYEEEQYILSKFPDAWFSQRGDHTIFHVSVNKESEVQKVYDEYRKLKRK